MAALQLEEAAGRWQVNGRLPANSGQPAVAQPGLLLIDVWPLHMLQCRAFMPSYCLQPEDGPHAEIADLVVELLRQKAPMLAEYFGIQASKQRRGG